MAKRKFDTVDLQTLRSNGIVPELPVALVVDDDAGLADSMAAILGSYGFAAQAAYDGADGLRLAARIRPVLLITDVQMPSMNGVELAEEVRRLFPACAVLLMSGQGAVADMLLRGANHDGHGLEVLSKPLHPSFLLGCLRRMGFCSNRAHRCQTTAPSRHRGSEKQRRHATWA